MNAAGVARRAAIAYALLVIFTLTGMMQRDAFLQTGTLSAWSVYHYRFAAFVAFPWWQGFWLYDPALGLYASGLLGSAVWVGGCWWTVRVTRSAVGLVRRLRKPAPAAVEPNAEDGTGPVLTRRGFLRFGVYTVPTLGLASSAYGIGMEPYQLRVRRYDFPVKDLPAWCEGLRIAHLSDFHSGGYVGAEYLRASMRLAMEQQPDIALLTGDFVSDGQGFDLVAGLIRDELKPRFGVLGTLGNHDHWQDAGKGRAAFHRAGVPLIDNNRRFLTPAGLVDVYTEDSLCIAGVGDAWEDVLDYDAALGGVPGSTPRIVLSHNPDAAEFFRENGLPAPRIDLMLSGHTHGGQVYIPGFGAPLVPSRFGQKYLGGLVQGPHWPVLVSRGIGVITPPVRFLVPPELSIITLRRDG